VRFKGVAYRAHDPRWSFAPLSGEGAATHGGRFNPKGLPALYLGLSPMTAIKEANQGFAMKIEPLTLCSYDIDCEDIVDLRTCLDPDAGPERLACGWLAIALAGKIPPTWVLARRLMSQGAAGVIAPSFAPGARPDDLNLVLWDWDPIGPHRVSVHDTDGRLPKDQISWTGGET